MRTHWACWVCVVCLGSAMRVRSQDKLPEGVLARLGSMGFRNDGPVNALAFSPDGKTIVSHAEGRGEISRFETSTGRLLGKTATYDDRKSEGAFSADRTRFASHGPKRQLVVWEVASGRNVLEVELSLGFNSVAFSPDGRFLALLTSSLDEGRIFLLDASTGKQLQTWIVKPHVSEVLAFAPDSKRLAAVGSDGILHLWDTETGKKTFQQCVKDVQFIAIAVAPDGKTVVCGGYGSKTIYFFELDTGRIRSLGDPSRGVSCALDWSSDGSRIVAGFKTGEICLLDPSKTIEVKRWPAHQHSVATVAFSPDGKTIASGSRWDYLVRLWDAETSKERPQPTGHSARVENLTFTDGGRTLVTHARDQSTIRWDLATWKVVAQINRLMEGDYWKYKPSLGDDSYQKSAISPDGTLLAKANGGWETRQVFLRGSFSNDPPRKIGMHFDPFPQRGFHTPPVRMRSMQFSGDGRVLATSTGDQGGSLILWDAKTGKRLMAMGDSEKEQWKFFNTDRSTTFRQIGLSHDGKKLATLDWKTLRIWDTKKVKEISDFFPLEWIESFSFSPDGQWLVYLQYETESRCAFMLLNVSRRKQRHLGTVPRQVTAMSFSQDNRLFAVRKEEAVVLYETITGQEVLRFDARGSGVTAMAFSQDGRRLAGGMSDGSVLVWDLTSRQKPLRDTAKELTAKELTSRWEQLGDKAALAQLAIWDFVDSPQRGISFLRERVRPVEQPDERVVKSMIAELEGPNFRKREETSRAILALGEGVEPLLRKALTDRPALETKRRLERLLEQFDDTGIRERRAVSMLEQIATKEAREVLQELARGLPNARLTREAQAALDRLQQR